MEQNVSKYPSLQTSLAIGFTILGTLVTAITISVLYFNFRQGLRDELRQRLTSITSIAALQQDGDLLLKVEEAQDQYFQQINEQNIKIKESDSDLVFVYTLRKNDQGIYFVVDAGRPGDADLSEFGTLYEEPSQTLTQNFDTMQQTIVETDFYTDEYGTFLSAYAPIVTASGEKIGVLGIDMSSSKVLAKERGFLNLSIVIFVATLPIIIVGGLLLGRIYTRPIANLANATQKIIEGHLETRTPDTIKIREVAQLSKDFNSMTSSLGDLIGSLEQRVNERTLELEESTVKIEKRAAQLETIADVSSSVASLQDLSELLPYITQTISQRFGFYHTGIFLLSEDKEYAVLRAANSEGGQKMLARKHRLRVGKEGIVGYSVAQKRARIALDTGEDAVFFNNPDLPATRSELALPLIIGSEVIGVLDVQSEQPNAFSNEDVDALTTLANQVAVAIENARLFQQSQDALQELDRTFQRYLSNDWRQFATQSRVIGYRAYETGLEPIINTIRDSEPPKGKNNFQEIPIVLRGVTLGTLSVNMGERTQGYSEEEISLIMTVSDRLALALESARLLENSQRAASKEQIIGEITGKIGSSINLRNVLQTAVEELGRAIPGSDVIIQLNPKIDKEAK